MEDNSIQCVRWVLGFGVVKVGLRRRETSKKEKYMKFRRSKFITKIIVFALIVYAGASLITLRGRIDAARSENYEKSRAVAEMEEANARLEHDIENHDDSDVKAGIAQANLGLVLPGEIIFFDDGVGLDED